MGVNITRNPIKTVEIALRNFIKLDQIRKQVPIDTVYTTG